MNIQSIPPHANGKSVEGLQKAWITPDKLYEAMLGVFSVVSWHFKTSTRLLQLFRRALQGCFAEKLQKCFVVNLSFGHKTWTTKAPTMFSFVMLC